MLDACAPERVLKFKEHHCWVVIKGKTFRGLPLGKHGGSRSTGRSEIQVGHVKQLCNFFDILTCAKTHIELLRH